LACNKLGNGPIMGHFIQFVDVCVCVWPDLTIDIQLDADGGR